jgi:hypothetical protein
MCEEVPPIRALNFLQNEVSSVVDHRSAEETEMFRSLLTYLLAPVPVPKHAMEKKATMSTSSHHRHSVSHSSDSSDSTTTITSLEHEDSRESSSRPKKRSRSDPDEGSEGIWTSEIAEEYSQGFSNGSRTQRLREMVDPLEAMIRGEDDRGGGGGGEGAPGVPQLTGARYSQRTEVFEYLLKFISDSEKQPSDSLLDLVGER